ncbi:TPA: hypothetical protein PWY45_002397 [Mannheimia haemolytica]|uniref:DUF6378 domain-containing protein n=2 Tax=Mannheimia haemolytica TaxID=75985 RepID=A0A378NEU2_MANHA|nr:DUF6378 domain-containing protein [Mannheimia haemolytica]AGQ38356.1 hypothetical protein J450_04160 [Mannheimia haemolytica D171]KYL21032.1 hypothetical protein AC574_11860 [Mannheimia haemolytica]MDW0536332.1 DUF6378 domain-containing protein [Mannheimia haemolytica]MDW0538948.1 DUF6378 domain-containing protein [Mannheimia haemolytica]MDW0546797.1 DUF6378 domain-containing protein [Mannheimia haemolytica]
MKTTQHILDEREQQHGNYNSFAKIYGGLRKVSDPHAEKLTWRQQISVEMILFKLARILNNGSNHQDSWQDIAGYALLGGDIYTPQSSDNTNTKGLPKPLTDSIYPESHLDKNAVWRLDLEFETKEQAVAVLEAVTGKKYSENIT